MPFNEMVKKNNLKERKKGNPKPKWRNQENFFKAIIDGMRCGVLAIDNKGRIVKINDIAKRILGLEGESYQEGSPISSLFDKHPDFSRMMLESFHMSTLPNRDEMEIGDKGKERKKIGFSISLVKDEKGQNIGSSIFFKDLTKIEEREEQERMKERLAALGHMSASLAHELKNPLGAIEINATFLKRKLRNDKEAVEILEGIISDINRLKDTINESLSFVKPLDLNLLPGPIDKMVDKALTLVLSEEDPRRIQIKKDYEKKLDPFLIDPDLMTKVFVNIFQNAIEAMNGKGTLAIELKKTIEEEGPSSRRDPLNDPSVSGEGQEYARIKIRDDGKGIGQDIIDKIFYPFFTTKEKGTGLGLSFSKKVVEAHRGKIDVESDPGSGTTFTIHLPITH